jgi:riboflavin synthase
MAVIPHTWQGSTLRDRRLGDAVNLEADLLAKYCERLLQARQPESYSGPAGDPAGAAGEKQLDAAWLAEHGWG